MGPGIPFPIRRPCAQGVGGAKIVQVHIDWGYLGLALVDCWLPVRAAGLCVCWSCVSALWVLCVILGIISVSLSFRGFLCVMFRVFVVFLGMREDVVVVDPRFWLDLGRKRSHFLHVQGMCW